MEADRFETGPAQAQDGLQARRRHARAHSARGWLGPPSAPTQPRSVLDGHHRRVAGPRSRHPLAAPEPRGRPRRGPGPPPSGRRDARSHAAQPNPTHTQLPGVHQRHAAARGTVFSPAGARDDPHPGHRRLGHLWLGSLPARCLAGAAAAGATRQGTSPAFMSPSLRWAAVAKGCVGPNRRPSFAEPSTSMRPRCRRTANAERAT